MTGSYAHTQHSPLAVLLAAITVAAGVAAPFFDEPVARIAIGGFAAVFAFLTLSFASLTVRDRGEHLEVRFGPLRLWGTKVRYEAVRAVKATRSSLLDGWGIHWLPGRGWIFNLWGFDCIEVTTTKGRVRIGTDDPRGLALHLAAKTGLEPG